MLFSSFLPVVKQLYLGRLRNSVDFRFGRITPSGGVTTLDTLRVVNTNTSSKSPKNMVYYAPRYRDYQSSNLFILAFNLETIFPCIAGKGIIPTCSRFTAEEDGFNKGQNIVEAGDSGNNFDMFGKGKRVYAFSVSGCQRVTKACFPKYYEISITCLLPREHCG